MEPEQVRLRRALVARALRRYRMAAGLTVREMAAVCGWDASKLSRIETGQRGIRPAELAGLLAEYGVADAERDVLLRLAEPGVPRWLGTDARLLPAAVVEYLAVEQAASELLVWAPCLVPDLLQIPDYTRPVTRADVTADDADTIMRVTLARQAAVSQNAGLLVDVVMGEAALRQQLAGPEIRSRQMRALALVGEQSPSVAVRIMPLAARENPLAVYGPFTIVRFVEAPGLTVVHLPGPAGGTCLTSPETTQPYLRAFQAGRSAALGQAASAALLRATGDA